MEMRSRRPPCTAAVANQITLLHGVAAPYGETAYHEMCVPGAEPVAMVKLDHDPVPTIPPSYGDDPAVSGIDRITRSAPIVEAYVRGVSGIVKVPARDVRATGG